MAGLLTAPAYLIKFVIAWFLVTVKKFQLAPTFPLYDVWKNYKDPYKTGVIYPKYEWEHECRRDRVTEKDRDHMSFHGSDPDTGDQLMVSFDRITSGVCEVWVVVRNKDRDFVYSNKLALDNTSENVFSAGGVRLECDAPMRYWRVAFNIVMNCLQTNEEVHVKLGARFSPASHPFEFPKSVPCWQLAKAFAGLRFRDMWRQLGSYCESMESYDQYGTMYCDLILDGHQTNTMLFGAKIRTIKTPILGPTHYYGYASNGAGFHLVTDEGHAFGSCYAPAHLLGPVRNARLTSSSDGGNFDVSDIHYEFKWSTTESEPILLGNSSNRCDVQMMKGHLSVGDKTFNLSIFMVTTIPRDFLPHRATIEANDALVLSTSDEACRRVDLTGGKGSSLAVLSSVSSQFKSFVVPKALVLTVNAYQQFSGQGHVRNAIDEMINKVSEGHNLKDACTQCVSVLEKAKISDILEKELSSKMSETFGMNYDMMRFAVRSSAVGEDSEDMSAAGQMTTFLGVIGQRDICNSIAKCWASQFAFTAVNYKRQYGQSLNSQMAVVVQEMVDAESAGVMFTCDPVTGNPLHTAITANYGLGETVVSASADPDTFIISKMKNQRKVAEVKIGGKADIIELNAAGGTSTKKLSALEASKACISEKDALLLTEVGCQVDSCYGTCRDIEWAILKGDIYLLQCRPVTSVFKDSDFEIKHDMSVALITNKEFLCRANLDEVLPGCISPLGISYLQFIFDNFTLDMFERMAPGMAIESSPYPTPGVCVIGNKFFMNISDPSLGMSNVEMAKAILISLFGKDVSDTETYQKSIAHSRSSNKLKQTIMSNWYALQDHYLAKQGVKVGKAAQKKFYIDLDETMNASQVLSAIITSLYLSMESGICLNQASFPSMAWNMKVLGILTSLKGEKSASPETMSLLSTFIKSNADLESANIPASLTVLSSAIRKSTVGERFADMNEDDALKWLETTQEEPNRLYREFIIRHGHRCYKEFDLHSNPWDIDRIKLIRMVKTSVKGEVRQIQQAKQLTANDLPGKPTLLQRLKFSYYVYQARYAVYARESTKSSLVYCIHTLRKAVRLLGRKMVEEGRIPDPELVHFFTFDELHRLLTSRAPALVERSIRRCRVHHRIDKEMYPVLLSGLPTPISDPSEEIIFEFDKDGRLFSGTPVSQGNVRGPAKVIKDFETEAHLIERGDILITHATDTGWTPYFPLLAGVVTEIGGLLSHGAVVAREYGLPAVVGVTGATQVFKTGDQVLIDGTNGTIVKLEATDD